VSTQVNQWFMWGIKVPYEWHDEWEKKNPDKGEFYPYFESFMDDSAFTSGVNHKEGIFCLFDGRDGKYIIIGRVFQKTRDGDLLGEQKPFSPPKLTELEKELIQTSVMRNFGLEGAFDYWFVTQLR